MKTDTNMIPTAHSGRLNSVIDLSHEFTTFILVSFIVMYAQLTVKLTSQPKIIFLANEPFSLNFANWSTQLLCQSMGMYGIDRSITLTHLAQLFSSSTFRRGPDDTTSAAYPPHILDTNEIEFDLCNCIAPSSTRKGEFNHITLVHISLFSIAHGRLNPFSHLDQPCTYATSLTYTHHIDAILSQES